MKARAANMLIEHIRRDGGTQIRAGLDEATVIDYAAALKGGAKFPPVTVFHDGTDHWLADGFHTTEAHLRTKQKRIAANIFTGVRRDAIAYACGANAEHGLRRSNADKRRAIETLLRDADWGLMADRSIAKLARVHHETVALVRKELRNATTEESREVTAVQGGEIATSAHRGKTGPAVKGESSNQAGRDDGDEGAAAVETAPPAAAPGELLETEVDLRGLEVSGQQIAEWGRLEDALSAFDSHLRAAQAALADEAKDANVGAELQALRQAAHDLAARARKSVRPKSVCLYCKDPEGTAGRRDECNGCHGRGWLTEEQLVSVPRELVGGDKVIDQKRGGFVPRQEPADPGNPVLIAADRFNAKQKSRRLQIQDDAGKELRVELDDDDSGPSW